MIVDIELMVEDWMYVVINEKGVYVLKNGIIFSLWILILT